MPKNPQSIAKATNTIINAWTTIAPTAIFAGMTLEQYKAKVKPSFDARVVIQTLADQMIAAVNIRSDVDVVTADENQKVVKSVVGDVSFGDDSNLYETMGYKRKSEKKSGLTKKSKVPPVKKL